METHRQELRRPPVIGVAGGVGAGKSAVAKALADLGCVVADSDALARQALGDPSVRETLIGWWGEGILDDAGDVDRSAVARIVFDRPPPAATPRIPRSPLD